MSYELLKKWLDDSSSVTEEEIDQTNNDLMEELPTGPNICLMAALGAIQDPDVDSSETHLIVEERVNKYEQEINW